MPSDFVGDVLDALGLDSTILVGASGGGIWATWYALGRPDRVRGLVMLGSVPTLPGGRVPAPAPARRDSVARGPHGARR